VTFRETPHRTQIKAGKHKKKKKNTAKTDDFPFVKEL
jgi:hypothetical protein